MTKVIGGNLQSIIEGCGAFQHRIRKFLEERGIQKVDPNEWYDLKVVSDALKYLETTIGVNLVRQIGKQIPKNAQIPPEIDTFEKALLAIDVLYKNNHGNAEGIGFYKAVFESEGKVKIICNTPDYSAAFNEGVLSGAMSLFGVLGRIIVIDKSGGGTFEITYKSKN